MNTVRCSRPTCVGEPAAWLAYDYEARCAWLDDEPEPASGVLYRWPLCADHADTLRVPRGWFSVDRRAPRAPGAGGEEPAGLVPLSERPAEIPAPGAGGGSPAAAEADGMTIPLDEISSGSAGGGATLSRARRARPAAPSERLTGIL